MKSFAKLFFLSLLWCLNFSVLAQEYDASSNVYRSSWADGTWNGDHKFRNVYCVVFPQPKQALEKIEVFYNNNAIHLTRVTYSGEIMANIVVSSVSEGRTVGQEINNLLNIERRLEKAYQHDFNIEVLRSVFGPAIQLQIKDVAPAGNEAPFPLVRPIFRPAKPPIESMSIHRLFVRLPDRYEIAIFQMAPDNANSKTEAEMELQLIQMADDIVSSLNKCSKQL